ncbi:hypothetical protein [Rhodopseudomonas sp. BR0G17]|uniref:hypothetical protein n=1 Tax=Rhodopseudomonas sp. BR0G17 TaxID=2269368 RepID=UPI0013DFCD51|nr:hypothetical protein [Rhodopseudomonas sp. BR0G17]
MKPRAAGTSLRLVEIDNSRSADVVVLEQPAKRAFERRMILVSADAIEARVGANPYSKYLREHGKLPEPAAAAIMGKLIGGRVRAADGTLQPPLTAAERNRRREIDREQRAAAKRYQQILRLRQAIAALAQNEDDPAELIAVGSVLFNVDEIEGNMDRALCYLNRFVEEWHRHGKKAVP